MTDSAAFAMIGLLERSFNHEHDCSIMNEKQEAISTASAEPEGARLPWELPRFRNWIAVAKVHMLVDRMMTAELQPLGLKCVQYDILGATFRFPGLTQQELADKLLVGRSNMSMLLPGLIAKGWIERRGDPGDARVKRLHLTAAGEAITRRAMQVQISVIEGMMGALSEGECNALGDMMRRIGRFLAKREGQ
jgi:MarR family transcriptional regulator, organic hydroperoxide resistance regulator